MKVRLLFTLTFIAPGFGVSLVTFPTFTDRPMVYDVAVSVLSAVAGGHAVSV